jgi:hypothetical protein
MKARAGRQAQFTELIRIGPVRNALAGGGRRKLENVCHARPRRTILAPLANRRNA